MLAGSAAERVTQTLEGVVAALPHAHVAESLGTISNAAGILENVSVGNGSPYAAEAATFLAAAHKNARRAQAGLELGVHMVHSYTQNITGAGRHNTTPPLKYAVYSAWLTPEPDEMLVNDRTAEQVHSVIDALVPIAEAGSTRTYVDVLQEQPDIVLCELLRRDVPLADYVLVNRHIKLILSRAWKIVRTHPNQSLEVHDLLNSGIEDYLLACSRYTDDHRAKLTTFATDYAYYKMLKVAGEAGNAFSVPYTFMQNVVYKIRRIDTGRINAGEDPMSDAEISKMFNIPLEKVKGSNQRTINDVRNAQRLLYGVQSLGVGDISDAEFTSDVKKLLTYNPRDYDTAWLAVENIMQENLEKEVAAALQSLDEREAVVIRAHFGIGEPAVSLSQIGKRMHYSADNVHLIEKKALAKIR